MSSTPFAVTLAAAAEADPERPVITCAGRTVTRRELDVRTNRLARAYEQLGVTPDSFVTIGLPNGIEWFESAIATWKLGATPQPVSGRLPRAELDAITELADPSLVVGLDAPERPCIPAGFDPDPGLADAPIDPPRVSSAWKAPTSGGSTGRPKLIVAGAPAITAPITASGLGLGMVADGVHLATGPLYHNGPLSFSVYALLLGNHVIVMERFDAEEALALTERYHVDWMYAVPTMMQRIWKLPEASRERYDLSSLQVVFHLAAPCPDWLKRAWIDWLGPERIWELYAGTESQMVTVIRGDEWLEHPGSVGRPILGEIRILDVDGREIPAGDDGEVFMRAPEGMTTYRYVGATARTVDGWESLGDMGHVDADGYLYLGDRSADMILVGGANVYPAEVEGALDAHPLVASSCVIGLPDDDLGHRVHAIIQPAGGAAEPVTDAQLQRFLADRLTRYKIPRTFERVDHPLRDDAGKVRRSALRAERLD
ncbi:MAG TPA: AMP-binding protein [Acidimicrobiia bacterium]|nr:AMP-binding protein [Acidimicrobiia bacterium]